MREEETEKEGGKNERGKEKEEGRKEYLIAKGTETEQIHLPNPEVEKGGICTTMEWLWGPSLEESRDRKRCTVLVRVSLL